MAEKLIQLIPDNHYHIYNHAIGNENFFLNHNDYKWFLEGMKKHIVPICDVLSYCLMPNHFHLVVRMKNEIELKKLFSEKGKPNSSIDDLIGKNESYLCDALSKQFSNFFNAYAKYFNRMNKRSGTLFKRAFRRKRIHDEEYLKQLICYLHQNPVKANLCKDVSKWNYSSYNAIISTKPTLICREEVITLFNDCDNFIFRNAKNVELNMD